MQAFQVQHHAHPDPLVSLSLNYLSTPGFDLVQLLSTIRSSSVAVKHICSHYCCQTNVVELKQGFVCFATVRVFQFPPRQLH